MLRTITVTYDDTTGDDKPPMRVGIVPPVNTLADLAVVLLMIAKANLEVANSTATALDTVDEIETNRELRKAKQG